MDDFKLIGKTEEQLQKLMETGKRCSDNIHTEFGTDSFAEIVLKIGKLVQWHNFILDIKRNIRVCTGGNVLAPGD